MANKFIRKIWNDPVWSNVIAGVIIPLLSACGIHLSNLCLTSSSIVAIGIGVGILLLIYNHFKSYLYDNETIITDRKLFDKFRDLDQSIHFLRNNDFGNPFDVKNIQKLYNIEEEKDKPAFKFLNPKLEKRKKQLMDKIIYFKDVIMPNTFAVTEDIHAIPSKWEEEQSEKFMEVKRNIHQAADEVCKKYDDLIKAGRKTLKV